MSKNICSMRSKGNSIPQCTTFHETLFLQNLEFVGATVLVFQPDYEEEREEHCNFVNIILIEVNFYGDLHLDANRC